MPLGLSPLNLSGVGLPRIGVGTKIKPRNPMRPAGQIGVPPIGSIGPQAPPVPRLDMNSSGFTPGFGDAETSPPTDVSSRGVISGNVSEGVPTNDDGTPNWVAILAPLLGAGLGAAMGGKRGALQGAVSGFGAVGQGMAGAAKIGREQAQQGIENTQKQEQLDIQGRNVDAMSQARVDAERTRQIALAAKTGIRGKLMSDEDWQAAQKDKQDSTIEVLNDNIDKMRTEGEAEGIKSSIDASSIPDANKIALKQRTQGMADSIKEAKATAQSNREAERGIRADSAATTRDNAETNKLIREADQHDRQRRHVEDSADKDTPYEIVALGFDDPTKPYMTKEQYDGLRKSRQAIVFKDRVFNQVIAAKKQAASITGKELTPNDFSDAEKIAQDAVTARQNGIGGTTGFDQAKVSKAISDRKGKASPDDVENLKEAVKKGFYTEQEAEVIAKGLGLSWNATVKPVSVGSDTTSIDNEVDSLTR